jgi:hypothetical protein
MGGRSAGSSVVRSEQAPRHAAVDTAAVLPLLLDAVLQEGVLASLHTSLHRHGTRIAHQHAAQIMWRLLSWPEGIKSLCAEPHAKFVCPLLHTILAGADEMRMDDDDVVHTANSIMRVMQHEDGLLLPFDLEQARTLLEYPSKHGHRSTVVKDALSSCWAQFQLSFFGG